MPTDTEQHKEVLLGNKQLLSMFFIGAILLGVAFTIGYVMGKNTAVKIGESNPAAQAPALRRPVEQPPAADEPFSSVPAPASSVPAPSRQSALREGPTAVRQAPLPVPVAEREPSPKTPAAIAPETVSAGSYLQIAALKREDADHVVKMLRSRGFAALLGESPKEGLFRVLVGPFQSVADLSETKGKLKAAGMESIVAR